MASFSGTATIPPRSGDRRRVAVLLVLLAAFGGTTLVHAFTRPSEDASFGAREVVFVTRPTQAAVSLADMAPGDVVTGAVTVVNGGVPLRYGIASTTTGELADVLRLTIRSGVGHCSTGAFERSGAPVYGPGPLGRDTSLLLVGSSGGRPLAPHARERLCFRVELPLATREEHAGLSSGVVFCFGPAATLGERLMGARGPAALRC